MEWACERQGIFYIEEGVPSMGTLCTAGARMVIK
jgi:hypothetical protein